MRNFLEVCKVALKRIFIIIAIISAVISLFYLIFKYLIFYGVVIDPQQTGISEYQYHHLQITFISASVTTLALIVALLKDEIKSLWSSAKIYVEAKFDKIITEQKSSNTPVVQAEYYYAPLNIYNLGSVPATQCTIILIELSYKNATGHDTPLDISSAKELLWTGKNLPQTALHTGGAKAEVSILQIKPSDVSNTAIQQNTPAELFIGGINASQAIPTTTLASTTWNATFVIYSQQTKPQKYKLEIVWDGKWHNRLVEMHDSVKIKKV